jgi:hypothetical protein
MTAFAPIANITGQPSISLPLGRTEDNLAVGMMFTAAIGREDTLLRIAGQLEAAAPLPRLAPPKADRKTGWPEVWMSSSRNENFLALVPQTLDGGRADRNHPVPARNLPQRGMGRLSNCGLVIGRSLDVNVVVYNESEGNCANLFD